jgi:hypothetical protein
MCVAQHQQLMGWQVMICLHLRPALGWCLQFWLIWPFIAWGALIVLAYAIGYILLGTVDGPIALFNSVSAWNTSGHGCS